MTEYKKLIYKVEDTFILGKTLPVVAMRQLPKLAEQFAALPDVPEYIPRTQEGIASGIMTFYNTNKRFMDDERELLEAFTVVCKNHHHSRYTLRLYEKN